jgi:hypothetical protein
MTYWYIFLKSQTLKRIWLPIIWVSFFTWATRGRLPVKQNSEAQSSEWVDCFCEWNLMMYCPGCIKGVSVCMSAFLLKWGIVKIKKPFWCLRWPLVQKINIFNKSWKSTSGFQLRAQNSAGQCPFRVARGHVASLGHSAASTGSLTPIPHVLVCVVMDPLSWIALFETLLCLDCCLGLLFFVFVFCLIPSVHQKY